MERERERERMERGGGEVHSGKTHMHTRTEHKYTYTRTRAQNCSLAGCAMFVRVMLALIGTVASGSGREPAALAGVDDANDG